MKIGVIGAGNLGTALAKRLIPAGHQMMLSYSRDEGKLLAAAQQLGALSGSPKEAAAYADVVALTVPWGAVEDALTATGPLDGRVLWDCTNALKPDLSGLDVGTTTSGAEIVSTLAKGAKVVKGIPPFAELLHSADPTIGGQPAGSFVCGDDAEAKAIVMKLLESLPATVVDAGRLENSRFVEPAGFLLVRLAYGLGFGSRIGLSLMRT